jgi:hypothetical protein
MRQVNRPAGEAAAIARLLASSMIGLQGSLALDSRNTGWTPVRGWHTTSPHASGQWWRGENPASVLEQAARLIRASYPCPRTSYRVILSSCSALLCSAPRPHLLDDSACAFQTVEGRTRTAQRVPACLPSTAVSTAPTTRCRLSQALRVMRAGESEKISALRPRSKRWMGRDRPRGRTAGCFVIAPPR